jgi:sodium/potassium/calcium exchanger 6
MLAGELVACLSTLGVLLDLPPAFLGLTVLAWGNSVGDLFTNTAVARQGLGEMAIAGCYGGPVFNILVGLGMGLLFGTAKVYPSSYYFRLDTSSILSLVFLLISLTSTVAIVSYRGFRIDKLFGIYLLTLYVVYTLCQATLVAF